MLQLPLRPLLPSLSRSFQPLLSALVFLELLVFHVPEVVIAQYGNIYHYDHHLILLVHHCYVQLVSHHQKCLQVPQDLGSVHCPSRLSDNREGIGCSDFVLFIQLIPEDLLSAGSVFGFSFVSASWWFPFSCRIHRYLNICNAAF